MLPKPVSHSKGVDLGTRAHHKKSSLSISSTCSSPPKSQENLERQASYIEHRSSKTETSFRCGVFTKRSRSFPQMALREEPQQKGLDEDVFVKKIVTKEHRRVGADTKPLRGRSSSMDYGSCKKKTHSRKRCVLKPVAETLSSKLRKGVNQGHINSPDRALNVRSASPGKQHNRSKFPMSSLNVEDLMTGTHIARHNSPRFKISRSATCPVPPRWRHLKVFKKNGGVTSPYQKNSALSQSTRHETSNEASFKFPVCKVVKVKLVPPDTVIPNTISGPLHDDSSAKMYNLSKLCKAFTKAQTLSRDLTAGNTSDELLPFSGQRKMQGPARASENGKQRSQPLKEAGNSLADKRPHKSGSVGRHGCPRRLLTSHTARVGWRKDVKRRSLDKPNWFSSKTSASEVSLEKVRSPQHYNSLERNFENVCDNNCGYSLSMAGEEEDEDSDWSDEARELISPSSSEDDVNGEQSMGTNSSTSANMKWAEINNMGGRFGRSEQSYSSDLGRFGQEESDGHEQEDKDSSDGCDSSQISSGSSKSCTGNLGEDIINEQAEEEEKSDADKDISNGGCDSKRFLGDPREALRSDSDSTTSASILESSTDNMGSDTGRIIEQAVELDNGADVSTWLETSETSAPVTQEIRFLTGIEPTQLNAPAQIEIREVNNQPHIETPAMSAPAQIEIGEVSSLPQTETPATSASAQIEIGEVSSLPQAETPAMSASAQIEIGEVSSLPQTETPAMSAPAQLETPEMSFPSQFETRVTAGQDEGGPRLGCPVSCCQDERETRLTVRQMVKCLQEKIKPECSSCSQGSVVSNTMSPSNPDVHPPKRKVKEWLHGLENISPGECAANVDQTTQPEGEVCGCPRTGDPSKPSPLPRKLAVDGKTLERKMECAPLGRHCEKENLQLEEDAKTFEYTNVGTRDLNPEECVSEDIKQPSHIDNAQDDDNGDTLTSITLSSPSQDHVVPRISREEEAGGSIGQANRARDSRWTEALEKAKRALKRMRSRSLSPAHVSAKINWLVERGRLSFNKVIKSWSNTDTAGDASIPMSEFNHVGGVLRSSDHHVSDASEPTAGPSRVIPTSTAQSSATPLQGDSHEPFYCLRINQSSPSGRRRAGSDMNPHRGFSAAPPPCRDNSAESTSKSLSISGDNEAFPPFARTNDQSGSQGPRSSQELQVKPPHLLSLLDSENISTVKASCDKTAKLRSHLPLCEATMLPVPISHPSPLCSRRTRSPTLESILETDSVSEGGAYNPLCEPCDCGEELSESACVDELPSDGPQESATDVRAVEELPTEQTLRDEGKQEAAYRNRNSSPLAKPVAQTLLSLPSAEIPTRASLSDCSSREARRDTEQSSVQDDLSGVLSSAPLKTQSLVNACDTALLSESGMTDMMALLSQEANIKRYPSYPDLTDLDDGESHEAGGSGNILGPRESFTAIQEMAELDAGDSESQAICDVAGSERECSSSDLAPKVHSEVPRENLSNAEETSDSDYGHNQQCQKYGRYPNSGQSVPHCKEEMRDIDQTVASLENVRVSRAPGPADDSSSSVVIGPQTYSTTEEEPSGVKAGNIATQIVSSKIHDNAADVCGQVDMISSIPETVYCPSTSAQVMPNKSNPVKINNSPESYWFQNSCRNFDEGMKVNVKSFGNIDIVVKEIFSGDSSRWLANRDQSIDLHLPTPPAQSPCDGSEDESSCESDENLYQHTDEGLHPTLKETGEAEIRTKEKDTVSKRDAQIPLWNRREREDISTTVERGAIIISCAENDVFAEVESMEDFMVVEGIRKGLDKQYYQKEEWSAKKDKENLEPATDSKPNQSVEDNKVPLPGKAHTLRGNLQGIQTPQINSLTNKDMQASHATTEHDNEENKKGVTEQKQCTGAEDFIVKTSAGFIAGSPLDTDNVLGTDPTEEGDSSLTGIRAISVSSGRQSPEGSSGLDMPCALFQNRRPISGHEGEETSDGALFASQPTPAEGKDTEENRAGRDIEKRRLDDTVFELNGESPNVEPDKVRSVLLVEQCSVCINDQCLVQSRDQEYGNRDGTLGNEALDGSKYNFFPNEDSGCDLSLTSQSRSYRSFSTDEDKSSGAGESLPLPCDVELKRKKKKVCKHLNSGEGPAPQPDKTVKSVTSSGSRGGSGSSGSNSRPLSSQNSPDINAAGGSKITVPAPLPRPPRAGYAPKPGVAASRHGKKEIKWDDEISFGDNDDVSTQSSSEMSSNRCNSCTSERSKYRVLNADPRKRSKSFCKTSPEPRRGDLRGRSRAHANRLTSKSYKSQVRRSPPPHGMSDFNPRSCLAKTGMPCTSTATRVSRSSVCHGASHGQSSEQAGFHCEDISHPLSLEDTANLESLLDQPPPAPGGDFGMVPKKAHNGDQLSLFQDQRGKRDWKSRADDHLWKTNNLGCAGVERAPAAATVGQHSSEVPEEYRGRKTPQSCSAALNLFDVTFDMKDSHRSVAFIPNEEQASNNNHSSEDLTPGILLTLKNTESTLAQLKYKNVPSFTSAVYDGPQTAPPTPTLSPRHRLALDGLDSPHMGLSNRLHQQMLIDNFQPLLPISLSEVPFTSSSTGSLPALGRTKGLQASSSQEDFASRLKRRLYSTEFGTGNAYNFLSRSQIHLDQCDKLIERSSHIIKRSQEMVAASRKQMESTSSTLQLQRDYSAI